MDNAARPTMHFVVIPEICGANLPVVALVATPLDLARGDLRVLPVNPVEENYAVALCSTHIHLECR